MMVTFVFMTTLLSRQHALSSFSRTRRILPTSFLNHPSSAFWKNPQNTLHNTVLFSTETTSSNEEVKKKKKRDKKASREKRRLFVGKAKAVDRGQYSVVYAPGGELGTQFEAKSGLPPQTQSTNSEKDMFVVLGIESSCDDTGAAVVRSDGLILGEALASQTEIHEEWGGVVPGLAKTAHEQNIHIVVEQALQKANLTIENMDAIGVTVGPGLEICLRVGCNKARELAIQHNKPFVGIHHLEAHILMARLPTTTTTTQQQDTPKTHEENCAMSFPFLALLVSGGHCQLLQCMGIGNYTILGGTLDDSLGEAYDKTARLLGLPIGGGGGPAMEKLALKGDKNAIKLPIPLQKRKTGYDFSYAGLKTAVRTASEKLLTNTTASVVSDLPEQDRANIAASFQHIAITHLEQRLERCINHLKETTDISTLAVVGGVAANQELRSRLSNLCHNHGWDMVVPPPRYCTDQGAMSAWAAIERIMVGSTDDPHSQEVYARYPFQQYDTNDQKNDADN